MECGIKKGKDLFLVKKMKIYVPHLVNGIHRRLWDLDNLSQIDNKLNNSNGVDNLKRRK